MRRLKNYLVIFESEWQVLWNSKASMIGQFIVEPIAYAALLGGGLQGWIGEVEISSQLKVPYLVFAYAGILCGQMIRVFGQSVYRLTVERRWGLYALKRMGGVGVVEYLLGIATIPVFVFFIQSFMILPIVFLLGGGFAFINLMLMFLFCFPLLMFWICLGTLFTMLIKNYQQRDLVIRLSLLPMMFGAPLFYPMHSMPSFLKKITLLNPVTYQVTALRNVLFFQEFGTIETVLVLSTILLFGLTVYTLNHSELLSPEH